MTEQGPEGPQELPRLPGGPEVGLGHYLHQRHPAPVHVHQGSVRGVDELAGVLLDVELPDAYSPFLPVQEVDKLTPHR